MYNIYVETQTASTGLVLEHNTLAEAKTAALVWVVKYLAFWNLEVEIEGDEAYSIHLDHEDQPVVWISKENGDSL